MKKLALASILCAFSMIATAQTLPNSDVVTINAAAQKINLPKEIRVMSPDEFYHFTGSYDLSNGKSLSLYSRGLKKYAAVQGEAWHEIVATSSNSFVSLDQQLEIKIVRGKNGDASGEVLLAAPANHLANNAARDNGSTLALH